MPEKKVLRMLGADQEKQYKERVQQLEKTVKHYQRRLKNEERISNSYIEKLHAAEAKVRELQKALTISERLLVNTLKEKGGGAL